HRLALHSPPTRRSPDLFTSTDPATGEAVWTGAEATAAQAAAAVDAARAAFPDWADRPRQDRIDAVKRYQAVLKDRADHMAEAISDRKSTRLNSSHVKIS